MSKNIIVTGSSGFIGTNLVKKLKNEGHYVIGADIVEPLYEKPHEFHLCDLRNQLACKLLFGTRQIDELYNLACLMGGMGYIGDIKHSYDIMVGSSQIVANIIQYSIENGVKKSFYSSSACCYNMTKQDKLNAKPLSEDDAYPLECDLIYGYQKAFSEQMYQAARLSHNLDIRIARFFNVFGQYGIYDGGKEKAPAALIRKTILAPNGGEIEVWGDGTAQRTFLHISECLEGMEKIMNNPYSDPINLGSTELVSINQLAQMVIDISGKDLKIKNIPGNVGVASRNTDNTLLETITGWQPSKSLKEGLSITYNWIKGQIEAQQLIKDIKSKE